MSAQLDHLVVIAVSLDEGVAWSVATLGLTPGPGGQHALMGTHNRLFSIASPAGPWCHAAVFRATAPAGRPLASAFRTLGVPGVNVRAGSAQLRARLQTLRGLVDICS